MKGIVLYTDGGCRPNPGYGGFGVHGYLFDTTGKKTANPKNVIVSSTGYVPKTSTSTEPVFPISYFDIAGSLSPDSTNTEAEIVALYKGLALIIDHIDDIDIANIHVDNQFVYDMVLQLSGIGPVDQQITIKTHIDLWEEIGRMLNKIHSKIDLFFHKVVGHSNDLGNDIADKLATIGLNIAMTHEQYRHTVSKVSDAAGYWKRQSTLPAILRHKFLFHHTQDPVPVKEYKTMDYDKDAPIGRAIRTATYVATKLDNVPILDAVIELQKKISDPFGRYYVVLLTSLSPEIQHYYSLFGKYIFTISDNDEDGPTITYLFKTQITRILSPLGLSYHIADIYRLLIEPLRSYVMESNLDIYDIADITNQLIGSKWLTKANDEKITIKTPTGTYRLFAGMSIPNKTLLKKLSDDSKIYLVTLKGDSIPNRFCVMIETDTFISVWLSYPLSMQIPINIPSGKK